MASGRESVRPCAEPPEFRRRAFDLVGRGEPVVRVAGDLGISESCPRRWTAQGAVNSGRAEGLSHCGKPGAGRAAPPSPGPGDGD